jgi:predicted PilT family ATPase
MDLGNVQIIFDGFNEYNFNIDVMAASFESMRQGLTLVEQEMPASISFHVPDQYHKRIIGIGGQHIQRIMKKHSVFVKFSNAMDRGEASHSIFSFNWPLTEFRRYGARG